MYVCIAAMHYSTTYDGESLKNGGDLVPVIAITTRTCDSDKIQDGGDRAAGVGAGDDGVRVFHGQTSGQTVNTVLIDAIRTCSRTATSAVS